MKKIALKNKKKTVLALTMASVLTLGSGLAVYAATPYVLVKLTPVAGSTLSTQYTNEETAGTADKLKSFGILNYSDADGKTIKVDTTDFIKLQNQIEKNDDIIAKTVVDGKNSLLNEINSHLASESQITPGTTITYNDGTTGSTSSYSELKDGLIEAVDEVTPGFDSSGKLNNYDGAGNKTDNEGAPYTINKDGYLVDKNGNVIGANGADSGYDYNSSSGKYTDSDGNETTTLTGVGKTPNNYNDGYDVAKDSKTIDDVTVDASGDPTITYKDGTVETDTSIIEKIKQIYDDGVSAGMNTPIDMTPSSTDYDGHVVLIGTYSSSGTANIKAMCPTTYQSLSANNFWYKVDTGSSPSEGDYTTMATYTSPSLSYSNSGILSITPAKVRAHGGYADKTGTLSTAIYLIK